GDPTGSAVERVLEWEREPLRRAAALTAALPRQVDEDVLAALLDVDDASDLFNWLRSLPFVTEQEGHCQYHEVVRAPMLRMLRGRSPRQWRRRHRQLASLQQESREALGLQDEEAWTDPGWQAHRLEETYHRLCADPVAALPPAL